MQIVIIALGSRGDVRPYVALGKGLHTAGHQVRLMTHDAFEPLVTAHGLEFKIARGNVQAVADSPEMQASWRRATFWLSTLTPPRRRKKPRWSGPKMG